jgi:hypothetical protein
MDTQRIYVGIDPGFTGYITVVDEAGKYIAHFKTPTIVNVKQIKKRTGKRAGQTVTKTKTELDEKGIHDWMNNLRNWGTPIVCVEKQHAMTGQGLASTAKNMYGYGFWVGLCKGLGYQTYPVGAVEWQKVVSDPKAEDKKAASVASVKAWNKDICLLKTKRSRIEDHNLADSINIARYAWHQYNEKYGLKRGEDNG